MPPFDEIYNQNNLNGYYPPHPNVEMVNSAYTSMLIKSRNQSQLIEDSSQINQSTEIV